MVIIPVIMVLIMVIIMAIIMIIIVIIMVIIMLNNTQEADGLVYAYILIWVAKSCGRRSTGFEGGFLDF